jgi:hypothetical protein
MASVWKFSLFTRGDLHQLLWIQTGSMGKVASHPSPRLTAAAQSGAPIDFSHDTIRRERSPTADAVGFIIVAAPAARMPAR